MDTVREVLLRTSQILKEGLSGEDVKVCLEYPSLERDYPLEKTTISVGLRSAGAAPGAFGAFYGRSQGAETYGRKLEMTVRITLHIPKSGNLEGAAALFAQIAELLLFSDLRPSGVSSEDMRYDRALGHYVMHCSAGMTKVLSQNGRQDEEIGDIIVKGVV